jgi:hypothetical protein
MNMASDDMLRALIRLIPPVRALKEDLEKSLHLEHFAGTGDLAVRSFNGLQASVAAVANDPYVATLNLSTAENATDKEKVSLALLGAGQLAAFLEGQTGLVGLGGNGSNIHQQYAPSVNIQNIDGVPAETVEKAMDIGAKAME